MPIDTMISGPMLDPFRNMLKECEEKQLSGPKFDDMKTHLNRMEEIAKQQSDLNEFNAQLMKEDLFSKFSMAYSAVLADAAKPANSGDTSNYDDAALLKTTVDAYKDSVQRIKDGLAAALKEAAKDNKADDTTIEVAALFKDEALIKPIEDVIKIGESGISLPEFLRILIEKGLDKAMEGSAVTREGYVYLLNWSKADMRCPYDIKMREEILQKFDELASKAAFGVPDSLEMTLDEDTLEHKYHTAIAKWNACKDLWDDILSYIDTWITSYCNYAPLILPWKMAADPRTAVIRTQDTYPGYIKVKLARFEEYFGLHFEDIFKLKSFINEVKAYRIEWSKERIVFLKNKVFPHCRPFNHPPKEVITEAEKMHNEKREINPELHRCIERPMAYYNSQFGDGRYQERFGTVEPNDSKAAPWVL